MVLSLDALSAAGRVREVSNIVPHHPELLYCLQIVFLALSWGQCNCPFPFLSPCFGCGKCSSCAAAAEKPWSSLAGAVCVQLSNLWYKWLCAAGKWKPLCSAKLLLLKRECVLGTGRKGNVSLEISALGHVSFSLKCYVECILGKTVSSVLVRWKYEVTKFSVFLCSRKAFATAYLCWTSLTNVYQCVVGNYSFNEEYPRSLHRELLCRTLLE